MGLFMIFDKEFWQEEKLMDILASKVIDAKRIECKYKDSTEIYSLTGLEIHFNVTNSNEIKIVDGKGETLYTVDCQFDANDKFQQHRSMVFDDLLEIARKRFKKQQKKAVRTKVQANDEKRESGKQIRLLQIKNAINRIK